MTPSAPALTAPINQGLREADPQVYAAIGDELSRQRDTLEMIASDSTPVRPRRCCRRVA